MSFSNIKSHISRHPLAWYMGIVILLKSLLISGLCIYAITYNIHDDQLMIEMTSNLLKGEWLGIYNNRTLVKGITFPIFLAINHALGLPYTFTLSLVYGLVCCFLIYVLKNFFKNKLALGVIFTFLYFLPSAASVETLIRVYRNSLAPVLAILVLASLWNMYFRRGSKGWVWSLLLTGISFFIFWNLREDSMWLLPVFLVGCIVTAIQLMVENKKKFGTILNHNLLYFLIPILVFNLCNFGIKAVNYHYYGAFIRNELSEGGFPKLMRAIYSVEPEEDIHQVSTPKSTVDKLYEESPTFATLQAALDSNYNAGWDQTDGALDGQIRDGWFFWCLRDCIVQSGYTTLDSADEFCTQAANEINAALEEGRLEKRSGMVMPSAIMSPWKSEYATTLPVAAGDTFWAMAKFDGFNLSLPESVGSENLIRGTEILTHNFAIYPSSTIKLQGWLASFDDQVKTDFVVLQNGVVVSVLPKVSSPDVYEFMSEAGVAQENMKECRFDIVLDLPSLDYVEFGVMQNDQIVTRIPYGSDILSLEGEGYQGYIDHVSVEPESSSLTKSVGVRVAVLELINQIYQKIGTTVASLGVLCYLFITVVFFFKLIKKRESTLLDIWLLLTSFLLSVVVLCLGVGYTTVSSYNAIIPVYIVGGVPLLAVFNIVSILYTVQIIHSLKEHG